VIRRVSLAVLLVALPSRAFAYESQCRGRGYTGGLEDSICAPASEPECEDGLDKARGLLFGEHTWLTTAAMELVGLGDFASQPAFLPYPGPVFTSYALNDSVEPAASGAASRMVYRPQSIPQLSQVPDVSFGLADFILGNEHCFADPSNPTERKALDDCHSFSSHMGPTNSTHFAPQNRAVYTLYHEAALAVAARCKQMQDAPFLSTEGWRDALATEHDAEVADCEREALSLQAVASHFMEDAWSTGHMWERWGSPLLAPTMPERDRALLVALFSGLQHGWRSVVRSKVPWGLGTNLEQQHDRMCMPGSWKGDGQQITWGVDALGVNDRYPGGGDMYLLSCTVLPGAPALTTSPELTKQYDRMMSCLELGFFEVYSHGPQTSGTFSVSLPDPSVHSSEDDCFEQRVTNKSMWLGYGITSLIGGTDPGVITRFMAAALTGSASSGYALGVLDPQGTPMLDDFSKAIDKWGVYLAQLAHDPTKADGYEAARLDFVPTLLGIPRNREGVAKIEAHEVPYLDRVSEAGSASFATGGACVDDSQCVAGAYCPSAPEGTPRTCRGKEFAIAGAFRAGETPAWCTAETGPDALTDAARACKAAGPSSVACDACVAAVLPHIRNACDGPSYLPRVRALADEDPRFFDHRAMCDVYGDAGLLSGERSPIYRPFDPKVGTGPRDAARSFCEAGKPPTNSTADYHFAELPPATAQDIHAAPACKDMVTCGAGQGTQWWRFSDPEATNPHVHTLTLGLQPFVEADGTEHSAVAGDVELTLFRGPRCDVVNDALPAQTVQVDGQTLRLTWNASPELSEVCVRVRPKKYTVWTKYQLVVDDQSCSKHSLFIANYRVCVNRTDGLWCWSDGVGTAPHRSPRPASRVFTGRDMTIVSGGRALVWDSRATPEDPTPAPFATVIPWHLGEPGGAELGEVVTGVVDAVSGCALRTDGQLWCRGPGWRVMAPFFTPSEVVDMSGNELANCLLQSDGRVWCLGNAGTGALGRGYEHDRFNALPIEGVPLARSLASNEWGGCLAGRDGSAWCWGNNQCGELGDGTVNDNNRISQDLPVAVLGMADVAQVAVGEEHSCALRKDGTVWCWGYDNEGEMGDGDADPQWHSWLCKPVPAQVLFLTDVVEIAADEDMTCAKKKDGTVHCWGDFFAPPGAPQWSSVPLQLTPPPSL
jgi:hypothetical protein